MLVPSDADFPLVFAKKQIELASEPAAPRDPRWDDIHKLWNQHAALSDKQIWQRYPQQWEALQQGLLHLELLLEAGSAYRGRFDDEKRDLQSLAESLLKNGAAKNLAAFNLPLSRSFGKPPSAEEISSLPAPWKPAAPLPSAKADNPKVEELKKEKPKTEEAKTEKAQDEKEKHPAPEPTPPAPVQYSYIAASTAVSGWASSAPITREKLAESLAFLDRAENRPAADMVEMQFLRMLVTYLDPPVWTDSPDSINRAILARNLAETAASPSDDRAFYWIFSKVEQGDILRRFAEDWLMVGSKTALDGAAKALRDAAGENGIYPQAAATAEQIAAAYRFRDRALSELPYLTRWLLARTVAVPSGDAKLRAAIDALGKLVDSLGDWEKGNSPDVVVAASTALQYNLETLENAYFQECADLRTAGEDKQTLASISDVLAVPLVTGQRRAALREEWLSIARKIESSGAGYRVAGYDKPVTSAESLKENSSPVLERLRSWTIHPILWELVASADALRAVESSPANRETASIGEMIARFGVQGGHVRRMLLGEREEAEKRLAETVRLVKIGTAPLPTPGEIRKPLATADRAIRAASPLLGKPLWDDPRNDPLCRLQNLDRHNLLLWHARRMLDDFWGPLKSGDPPYFETAVQSYLTSAAELFKEDVAMREGSLPALFETRKQAAAQGLQMEKPRDLFIDDKDPGVKQKLAVSAPEGFPQGVAAVYLQNAGGTLFPVAENQSVKESDLRRMAEEIAENANSRSLDFWILNNERLRATPQLQAAAYFRGYLRTRDFYVQPAAGVDIAYQKPAYPKPTICVRGDTRQTTNLMFIFDCSGSMGAKVRVNGPGGPGLATTRLQVARGAIEEIFQRLIVPRNPYQIGLIVYGHRVGWNPKNQNEIVMRNPKNPGEFIAPPPEFNVHPSDDVELVLPLGPFTREEYAAAKNRLDSLVQTGETPLYLSILQALGDLESAESGSARHIVVLTDGGNEQSGGDPKLLKTLSDLEKAFAQPNHRDVKLDVLGFDLSDAEARALRDLAPKIGGKFYSVTDPSSLTSALEKSLGLVKYEVLRLRDGKPVTPEPLDLNATCETLEKPGDRPIGYRVELVDRERPARTDVATEGGEALELFVKEDPNLAERRLVFHRYEKALRDSAPKVPAPGDAQKRSFFLGAHLPEWTGGGAKFFVSVQNADADQFCPRPAEIWAEIKPVMPEGAAELPPYIFYDRRFEPDRPVPILDFFAPSWPPESKDAEIRFWCKLQKTPPDKQVSVAEARGKSLQIEGVPDVTFELETIRGRTASEPFRIIVTERHPAGGDLSLVKVEMSPSPESIKRRYNYKTGVIVHTFYYDDSAAAEADRYQLLFTSKQKLLDGAIAAPRPLKVTVPRE
jgi:Mg-chelatase subunit ChlD